MKRFRIGLLASLIVIGGNAAAMDTNGMVHVVSKHDVATTTERLVGVIKKKGLKHFATIDHAAGAASVDQSLPPTRLVLFGNPKIGTPLMKCARGVAIDLPQKALIWEDDSGTVRISYNAPAYLNKRHGLAACEKVLGKIKGALAGLTGHAAGK